jgi:hypothetical protein
MRGKQKVNKFESQAATYNLRPTRTAANMTPSADAVAAHLRPHREATAQILDMKPD